MGSSNAAGAIGIVEQGALKKKKDDSSKRADKEKRLMEDQIINLQTQLENEKALNIANQGKLTRITKKSDKHLLALETFKSDNGTLLNLTAKQNHKISEVITIIIHVHPLL